MTARMAEGFTDDTTGKFINHGTIGAASPDSVLTVNGNLDSDGVLQAYGGKSYTLRNNQDKTHFIFSLSGETEFAKGWFLSGETLLQKGAHDKDISASVQFKRVW